MPVNSKHAPEGGSSRAAELCCQGDFRGAIELLGDGWPGVAAHPRRGARDDIDYARLLMVCAVISMNVGAMSLRPTQNAAKNMLSQSARLFKDHPEAQSAKLWLGVAYLRCGENHEAIALASTLLAESPNMEVVFGATMTKAIGEMQLGNVAQCLTTLDDIKSLVDTVPPLVQGKYYLNRGMALRGLDRLDEALAAYELAGEMFQQAGSARYEAAVSNNAARVYSERGEFVKAHVAADRAASLLHKLQDRAHEAKAWDEIARIYLREGNLRLAARASQKAVDLLSGSDHEGWLAEALTTHGVVAARRGVVEALQALQRAAEISERVNNAHQAEIAYSEMWNVVKEGKALIEVLRPVERLLIARALDKHDGSLTLAARSLGIRHQSLDFRIRTYFPDLMTKRKAPVHRRKSIMKRDSG